LIADLATMTRGDFESICNFTIACGDFCVVHVDVCSCECGSYGLDESGLVGSADKHNTVPWMRVVIECELDAVLRATCKTTWILNALAETLFELESNLCGAGLLE
jgi:hypothetical protein